MSSLTQLLSSSAELSLVFLLTSLFIYYLYYKQCFTYWKKKGLCSLQPVFPVGDLGTSPLGAESIFVRLQTLYHRVKDLNEQSAGIYFFNGPLFFPVHPDLIKRVLVTDFDHFVDRGMYINEEKLPITNHMFSMKGDQWRKLRAKFSPTFTSGKMKSMYNIISANCQNLVKILEPFSARGEIVDIKDFCMRLMTDIIGSTAFGVDCNSLKDPETEFAKMVAQIFSSSHWKLFKLALEEGLQNPGNIIKIAHDNQTVIYYFTNLVKDTIEYRDKNKVVREDFLNTLMEMRADGLTLDEIVAQSFLFFTAGFETSSSTMSYCIHELSHQPELQERLREEIHQKLGRDSSKYSYDDILSLPYLDLCFKETLRKYPPVAMLNRIVVKPYKIPETEVVVDEGTPVIVSVLGLHRDPDYFEDPMKFIPDRFDKDHTVVPYTYLPFGDGPRNCIGLRFGTMQAKLGLATLLNDYKFLPTEKTKRDLPIDPKSTTIVLSVLGGIHTKIVKN